MNIRSSNTALAILLGGASIVTPALAQEAAKPVPGAALQYVGSNTRLGLGVDSDNNVRGELFQVLRSDDRSATLAELWASRNAGGAKLSHHWASGTNAVNKVFAAFDQGDSNRRKATLGGGQEYERWFWDAYLSRGLSGARLDSVSAIATTVTQSGTDGGRPYVQDVTTTVTTRTFSRAYDWGVGARAGHFYEAALVRVTAGVDYEWGKFSSRQWTGSLTAEKFFATSPISVALSGEIYRKSGDFEGTRNDQRGMLMLRYDLGGAKGGNFRPSKVARMVTSTERVPDPNWKPAATAAGSPTATAAPTGAKASEPPARMETRTTRSNRNDEQETYFDLGSFKLKAAGQRELDGLVSRIAEQRPYVDLKVNIVGHTCPTGSDRNNLALSKRRAEVVKAYLVGKGVPENLITTDGKAGRNPKYPEVKGQSFRNRRADTEVLIVKEQVEQIKTTINAAPATPAAPAAAVAAAPATPATAPMIERQVQREVIEDVPNNWMLRALHNPAQHKSTVDSYRYAELTTTQTTGARRYLNRPPVAVNDAYTIDCGAAASFDVLANDSDPDGDTLTLTSVGTPSKGSASIANGRIVYTPNAASCAGATDSFSYTVSDGKGGSASAMVTVTIRTSNHPPIARDDTFVVGCRSSMVLDVLANDSDPDGDPLTIASITQPADAVITITSGGKTLTYTPGPACFLRNTFTYTVSDGKGGSATATVTLIDP